MSVPKPPTSCKTSTRTPWPIVNRNVLGGVGNARGTVAEENDERAKVDEDEKDEEDEEENGAAAAPFALTPCCFVANALVDGNAAPLTFAKSCRVG